ncbi:MAG: methyltransferase RsmF C-terminal domain-like protein [Candidatus Woesearchaeota archaeon]
MGRIRVDFLNSKQRKQFFRQLQETYGYSGSTEYAIYLGGDDKYYVVSSDIDKVDFVALGVRQGGLYVASKIRDELRLTMDGAMLFGPSCSGCFVEVNESEKNAWMRGEELETNIVEARYVLIKYKNKILGCGHAANNSIKPYISKGRRISDPH